MGEGEAYLKVLDVGYFEVQEAFKGLADENVWKRPTAEILSVGELAGHIAYWEAVRLAGEGLVSVAAAGGELLPDLAKCRVSGPFLDHRFMYYPITLAHPPEEQHLAMTAEQVRGELVRVHEEAVAHFRALNPDLESEPPGKPSDQTYGNSLRYLAIHVSYHAGQMYTVRHLLGEETPDNWGTGPELAWGFPNAMGVQRLLSGQTPEMLPTDVTQMQGKPPVRSKYQPISFCASLRNISD